MQPSVLIEQSKHLKYRCVGELYKSLFSNAFVSDFRVKRTRVPICYDQSAKPV